MPCYFDADLAPSRSLGRRGFVVLLAVLIAANAVLAIRFWLIGGWPVLPFLGLDIAGIVAAFWLSYRAGRIRERILLDHTALTVTHVDPRGASRNWSFEPAWVRVSVNERPRGCVAITTNGRGVIVAEFLSPRERRDMAAALRSALAERMRSMAQAA